MKKILLVLLFAMTPGFAFADATSTVSTSSPQAATITIRDGSVTAFSGTVELAASTTPPIDITPTNATTSVSVPADSLLATLVALDATSTDFNITDLGYFSSFNSFIINCIAVPAASTTDCYNWTYAVNGVFPQVGVDHQILHDGDVVYLFFGPSRQTALSTTTVVMGESFTATAQSYDLATGAYVGASGLTLGVGTPNPDFSFTELSTSTSDASGQAIFTLNATGTFSVGIQEDFYFPTALITVTEAATLTDSTSTPPVDNPPPTGGGGGGPSHLQLNVSNALAYLTAQQRADGSFGSSLLSDWAALAFAASDPGAAKAKLRNYLLSATPALSAVTDYERHAMALMALGIDPYSGTPTNYIVPITNAFDGTQIGSLDFENDDIFALFPLLHAGYGTGDDIIQKAVAFIVARQLGNGSWTGGVDMTAAAIQALALVPSLPNVSTALTKAESYLRSQQQSNGGWGNSFSTSWALQAIAALGQSPSNWQPSAYNPNDYLATLQQSDGGVEPPLSSDDMRVWATAYAIPGALGKTWGALLSSFAKQTTTTNGGGGAVLGASTSTLTTSTIPSSATTTLPMASSTPETTASSTPTSLTTSPTLAVTRNLVAPNPAHIKAKKPAVLTPGPATPPVPSPVQTTAAAASNGNFFANLWDAIASFFSRLF